MEQELDYVQKLEVVCVRSYISNLKSFGRLVRLFNCGCRRKMIFLKKFLLTHSLTIVFFWGGVYFLFVLKMVQEHTTLVSLLAEGSKQVMSNGYANDAVLNR
jgi:hypothetical protein